MKKVVVIEDDAELLQGLKDNLEIEGYEVETAVDGQSGVMQVVRTRPDAIILDIMLPRLSGFDVCRTLRERGIDTPILILTARSQESDKILGLELGADDYVTKPFSIHELLARLRSAIRRFTRIPTTAETFGFGRAEVNFATQQVWKDGTLLNLSTLEFDVLRYFIAKRGEVIPREHLLREVWGYHAFRTSRAVDNLVGRLRCKLEDHPQTPRHTLTVYGIGYKFVE